MTETLEHLIARHATTLDAAIDAIETRKNWSPFRDSPSSKFHAPGKPEAGKAAFETLLGKPFDEETVFRGAKAIEDAAGFAARPAKWW